MEIAHYIGFTCILLGITIVVVTTYYSHPRIRNSIFKASLYISLPVIVLALLFYFGFNFAEAVLFDLPCQIVALIVISIYSYYYSGFKRIDIPSFIALFLGLLLFFFGLFFVIVIATMHLGF
ncbi:hypothetical protein [Cellulophaga baltica]|uniref:Uncharacterized protein n=1 Tax=Cellulophaga baltica TaxID=76594 RepID=A0A1G7KA09_9FLAO|nr:hypothetical protein [Cellulophaga baltica]SDF34012.1 hypothetical protein SAMN04487992_11212 [Cellulophaga baltica]